MKIKNSKEAWKFAMWGALFGCLFPILATIIESNSTFQSMRFEHLMAVQRSDALLWIINTAPLFLGLFAFFIGQHIDILSLKNQEIVQAQAQLILQEQMASVGKMTAGIVHEIKNPLNFVSNFSEGSVEVVDDLVEELKKQKDKFSSDNFDYIMELIDDLKQNALDIKKNSDRVNRIVFTLLDHTRGSKGMDKPVNLNVLLDENVNLAFHSYRANYPSFNLAIEKDYQQNIPLITLNAQSLGRVLLNLLNNACYALNQKQNTGNPQFEPVLSVKTQQVQDCLKICIRDNGHGIPQTIREKIFEPFFTTKPTGEGNTGLGLSISKDIILKEYNGQIEVESEEGQYTQFVISLPLQQRIMEQVTSSTLLKSA